MAERVDRAERLVRAAPEWVYRALTDPDLLVRWLPPRGARMTIDAFDPRPGGAFAMTLTFDAPDAAGKSTPNSDVVKGHFTDLVPGRSVVQLFSFESSDSAFAGDMEMTWTLEPQGDSTLVKIAATHVPSGISPEDHQAGLTSSLDNLAALADRL